METRSEYRPDFTVGLRGYDRKQVDALAKQVMEAMLSRDTRLREGAQRALAERALRVRLIGFDREQVDNYFERLAELLAKRPA